MIALFHFHVSANDKAKTLLARCIIYIYNSVVIALITSLKIDRNKKWSFGIYGSVEEDRLMLVIGRQSFLKARKPFGSRMIGSGNHWK